MLRALTAILLDELLSLRDYAVAVHLVSARKMAVLNEQFLQHEGPTDVITFDLRDSGPGSSEKIDSVTGEIFICVAVGEKQAVEFGTTWQAEIVRYVAHGVLHLLGYDDLVPDKRKAMKRQENRLVTLLARRCDFAALGS